MKQHRLLFLAVTATLAAALFPFSADAQNDFNAFYNRYRFYQIGVSARSAAMGGVYSALTGDEMGLLGNPASLGFSEKPYLMLEFEANEASSALSMTDPLGSGQSLGSEAEAQFFTGGAGFSYPFEWGAVGIHYNYRDDDIEGDPYVFPSAIYNLDGGLQRHNISAGIGYRVMDQWAVGYRYSFLTWDGDTEITHIRPEPAFLLAGWDEEFDGHKNHFGTQYQYNDMFTLGLDAYFGLGNRNSAMLGDADADSYGVRGGAAWKVTEEYPLLVAMDVNYEYRKLDGGGNKIKEDLVSLHLGAEYPIIDNLFLRAGYQYNNFDYDDAPGGIFESPTISGYSAGFGYTYGPFSLDYGFVYNDTGSGDMTHVVGVGYHF